MSNLLRKFATYLIVILGIMCGYQYMTGKSLATLPREIADKLQQKATRVEYINPQDYRDPAKNMLKD